MTGSFGNFRFPGRKEVGKNAQYLVVWKGGKNKIKMLLEEATDMYAGKRHIVRGFRIWR